jgi:hypothetical protein
MSSKTRTSQDSESVKSEDQEKGKERSHTTNSECITSSPQRLRVLAKSRVVWFKTTTRLPPSDYHLLAVAFVVEKGE